MSTTLTFSSNLLKGDGTNLDSIIKNGFLGDKTWTTESEKTIWYDRSNISGYQHGDTVAGDYYILEINAATANGSNFTLETFDLDFSWDSTKFELVDTADLQISDEFQYFNQVDLNASSGTARITAGSSDGLGGGDGLAESAETTFRVLLQANNDVVDNSSNNSTATFNDVGNTTQFNVSVNSFDSILTTGSGSSFSTSQATGSESFIYNLGEKVSNLQFDQGGNQGLIQFDTDRTTGFANDDSTRSTKLIRQGDTVLSGDSAPAITITNYTLDGSNADATSFEYSVSSQLSGVNVKIDSGTNSLDFSTYSDSSVNTIGAASYLAKDSSESVRIVMNIDEDVKAGTIIDTADFYITAKDNLNGDTETTNFVGEDDGSGDKSLVTYAADLNLDGRVSMVDLAYLNSGAGAGNYARDVDVNFDGQISLNDLERMDEQFGDSIHSIDNIETDLTFSNGFTGNAGGHIVLDADNDKAFLDQNLMEHSEKLGENGNHETGTTFAINDTLLTDSFDNINDAYDNSIFNDSFDAETPTPV